MLGNVKQGHYSSLLRSPQRVVGGIPFVEIQLLYNIHMGVIILGVMITIDNSVGSNQWWKDLCSLFARPGEYFEIHCWLDESEALQIARQYGSVACYGMPDLKVIHGTLTDRFISFLMNEDKPQDCDCYNKMIPFFTIRIGECFSSEKYGTEIILQSRSKVELERINKIISNVSPNAKIYQNVDSYGTWRSL